MGGYKRPDKTTIICHRDGTFSFWWPINGWHYHVDSIGRDLVEDLEEPRRTAVKKHLLKVGKLGPLFKHHGNLKFSLVDAGSSDEVELQAHLNPTCWQCGEPAIQGEFNEVKSGREWLSVAHQQKRWCLKCLTKHAKHYHHDYRYDDDHGMDDFMNPPRKPKPPAIPSASMLAIRMPATLLERIDRRVDKIQFRSRAHLVEFVLCEWLNKRDAGEPIKHKFTRRRAGTGKE